MSKKTETYEEFLARGGKVTKGETPYYKQPGQTRFRHIDKGIQGNEMERGVLRGIRNMVQFKRMKNK